MPRNRTPVKYKPAIKSKTPLKKGAHKKQKIAENKGIAHVKRMMSATEEDKNALQDFDERYDEFFDED